MLRVPIQPTTRRAWYRLIEDVRDDNLSILDESGALAEIGQNEHGIDEEAEAQLQMKKVREISYKPKCGSHENQRT